MARLRRALLLVCSLLLVGAVTSCASTCSRLEKAWLGTKVVAVALEADGVAGETRVKLAAGTRLNVVVRYDAECFDDFDELLEVALLRDDRKVASRSIRLTSRNRNGQHRKLYGVINPVGEMLVVPDDGADAFEASFRIAPKGAARFQNLEIALYRKD